jgi:uncharacterized protein (DUF1800 family)
MSSADRQIEHLLRRAGFGARPDELAGYRQLSMEEAVDVLVDYESIPDNVDSLIGKTGYVGMTITGPFSPQTNIGHARQRWLFRMVHSDRPLQEKMTLFWHNHFATGYNKIAGVYGAADGARYMAAKASDDAVGIRGQIEMLRANALGNFRDILTNIAKDVAMVIWLDGRTNFKAQPQENFGREIMELFSVGVGNYTESDVYAAARVFTGWNLQAQAVASSDGVRRQEFFYNPNQHETNAKTFSFAIYPDGGKTIPARSAAAGMQDGIDFINGLAAHPNTARYLATKLYRFFVSEFGAVNVTFVERIAQEYLQSRYDMRAVMRAVLRSPEFWDESAYFARYAWPAEFVVRALKDVGWSGFSVNDALAPMSNMGMVLYEPPDVSGWRLGEAWFSTSGMLSRMNFASTLASNQRFNLLAGVKAANAGTTPEAMLAYYGDQIVTAPMDSTALGELNNYLHANGAWTTADARLMVGSPENQFV